MTNSKTLLSHTSYREILRLLPFGRNDSKEKGLLGVIFRKSQNKIQDPAKLKRSTALELFQGITENLEVKLEVEV
ncbi:MULTISPECIES: hypothetical protein [unclassified Anabaena]|uniref:hypothetical protein n=1 Tax=unclassified Anabaena TaxID=2619674 RepID=UPI0014482755|nr:MULTISPECIES: hypothetical protein [unclassified Anabaena]MTJ10448.1 hypothetical protein [Anabaena sp. UHCC 0204]MTJ55371.1 hypothetical protein [Anabaena sp. UHCC 0253]